jgi:hypothetical protein
MNVNPVYCLPSTVYFLHQMSHQSRNDLWAVMLFSGLCGVYFGLTTTWQIAVESAQVLAGIVTYPPDNPFFMYHVKSWTLLHQIPALLLSAGLSERVVAYILGCTAAVLSFESLALCTFAFSRSRHVACGVPLLCLASKCFQETCEVYPLRMLCDVYWTTYGVTGTYYVLLVWSLIGLGFRRTAAFLCGLAPAVHPALGTWCIATAGVALAWQWWDQQTGRRNRENKLQFALAAGGTSRGNLQFPIPYFIAGLTLTAGSFAIQQYLARDVPTGDPLLARQMLEAFVDGWDNHRFPVPLDHIQWQIGWCTASLASVALAWCTKELSANGALLLRIVMVTTIAGLAMCWLTWCTHWLPLPLVMAMPGRFLNFAVVLCPALIFGFAWRWRALWPAATLFAVLVLYCVLRTVTVRMELFYVPAAAKLLVVGALVLSCLLLPCGTAGWLQRFSRGTALASLVLLAILWRHDWRLVAMVAPAFGLVLMSRNGVQRPLPKLLEYGVGVVAAVCPLVAAGIQAGPLLAIGLAAGTLCGSIAATRLLRSFASLSAGWHARLNSVAPPGHKMLNIVCGMLCLALVAWQSARQLEAKSGRFSDWQNDPVFAAAHRSDGLLLTAPRMGVVQLRSRRGVLLNGEAMNQLTYVPASGPAMNHMLNDLYGDDLLRPRPAGWIKAGGLMRYSAYDLWQDRTPDEWQRLAAAFGFRHIVTYPDWKLNLPLVASSRDYLLYEVPNVKPSRDETVAAENKLSKRTK